MAQELKTYHIDFLAESDDNEIYGTTQIDASSEQEAQTRFELALREGTTKLYTIEVDGGYYTGNIPPLPTNKFNITEIKSQTEIDKENSENDSSPVSED